MSLIIGLIGITASFYFAFTAEAGGFTGYFDTTSAVLLGVAPPSIMLLSHSWRDIFTGIGMLFKSTFSRIRSQHEEVIVLLTEASKLVRSEGLGALMPLAKRAKYPLLRDGLAMILNDFQSQEIRHNLNARIQQRQGQMMLAANLFENMSKVCPGVGMIGTLLGLIAMMSNMEDPGAIGAGMALAMVTTLYGIMLGTIIYAPWSEKIALEAEKTMEVDLLVLEGVLNIKGKKSSIHLKDIVNTYGHQGTKGKKGA